MSQRRKLYVAGSAIISMLGILALALSVTVGGMSRVHAAPPDPFLATSGTLPNAAFTTQPAHTHGHAVPSSGVSGVDTLTNFTGQYAVNGAQFHFAMVGNDPSNGHTTTIDAPVIPVSLDLRNADGTPAFAVGPDGQSHRLVLDPQQFVQPVLNSPVFQDNKYTSSNQPTQFADAVAKAEFQATEKQNWHTVLAPEVKTARTMVIDQGTAANPNYIVSFNTDGSIRFVLVNANVFQTLLFPQGAAADNSSVIGAAEVAGDITSKDVATFLFPNTFLFIGNPSVCCIVGFHSLDVESGDASNGNLTRLFVINFSSWISPGIFNHAIPDPNQRAQDVTALSHEVSELYNDPFVGLGGFNITPWWLAPNGNCQNDLETGDVIEGLPDQIFPIQFDHAHDHFLYHPQNEALLQWFQFQTPSTALDGAYSYPNEQVLTAVSAPQNPHCK